MAIDSYMFFQDYKENFLPSESQVTLTKTVDQDSLVNPFIEAYKKHGLFEVEDYSFDIEQTLNIGSQSSGSGAGKVNFNPFSITRKIDCASTQFFQMACSGTPFKFVGLGIRKSTGGTITTGGSGASGALFLVFTFKLVAVKTVSWAHDDEAPKETVTFEYGGLNIQYSQQKPDGTLSPPIVGGWNRVKNISDPNYNSAIT
jgi:type VI secretion system secreted protein Hcp